MFAILIATAVFTKEPPKDLFVATPVPILVDFFTRMGKQKDKVFYDLGSGDGRVLVAAAKLLGCKAIGIENDKSWVGKSRMNIRLNLPSLIGLPRPVVHHEDFFKTSFEDADIVYAHLSSKTLKKLIPKFRELKEGSLVITFQHQLEGYMSASSRYMSEEGDTSTIYFYTIPLEPEAESRCPT